MEQIGIDLKPVQICESLSNDEAYLAGSFKDLTKDLLCVCVSQNENSFLSHLFFIITFLVMHNNLNT